jgi:hypothetical protein
LIATIRLASASYSTIRSMSRNGQRCGISASISRTVWIVVGTAGGEAVGAASVTGGSMRIASV